MIFLVRLLRIILIVAALYLVYRLFFGKTRRKGSGAGKFGQRGKTGRSVEEMKKDPVCGTFLPPSQALTSEVDGDVYFFCSQECRNKFLQLKKK